MTKIYTRATWVDEVLAAAERYNILEDGGGAYKANMQINLATGVSVAGTTANAARLNNIEAGVDALDTKVSVVDYRGFFSDAGSPGRWLRIASIGASATGDTLLIECTGAQYGASNNFVFRARIGGSISGAMDRIDGNTLDMQYARLVAYNNSGVITVYLYIPGTLAAYINATVWKFSGGTGTTFYPGEAYSTSTPSGSLVFDSYTAAAVLTINAAGDIYSVPWTDYSATSTIAGWASFTTKLVTYKKIGKLVFVAFELVGTSNLSSITFTLPFSTKSTCRVDIYSIFLIDNDVAITAPGLLQVPASSSTAAIYKDATGAALFTTSGGKTCIGQFFYEAA